MVAGFQTKAEVGPIAVDANQPWFSDATATYTNVTDLGTTTEFESTNHGLQVGDVLAIFSSTGTSVNLDSIAVSSVTDDDNFVVDFDVMGSGGTGNWYRYDSIIWSDSTPGGFPVDPAPAKFLREIHVQFSTSSSAIVEVSFDNGETWLPLNNNAGMFGLATFTMFVKFDSVLNFRSTTATTVDITVTGD